MEKKLAIRIRQGLSANSKNLTLMRNPSRADCPQARPEKGRCVAKDFIPLGEVAGRDVAMIASGANGTGACRSSG